MMGMFFAQRDMKWNLDITKGQGNSFSYILLLLGQGYCSLYQGLCYIEVRYVEVPLCCTCTIFFRTIIQLELFIKVFDLEDLEVKSANTQYMYSG